MDDNEDPLLQGKSTSSDGVHSDFDPYTEGLFVAGLTNDQIAVYGEFLNDIYQQIRNHYRPRQVTRNAMTMLQGAVFALGTKKLKNLEWKEHCASSLRETFHEWKGEKFKSDFIKFFRNGKKLTVEEDEIFRDYLNHYRYFSGIDHHEASGIIGSLGAILEDRTLKLEDCYKDEIFIERVKHFFSILTQIIELSKKEPL